MTTDEPVDFIAIADRLYAALKNWPDDGKPDRHGIDPVTITDLLFAGHIERRETTKRCPACGTEKFDHAWLHITSGGRLFMAVMAASRGEQ